MNSKDLVQPGCSTKSIVNSFINLLVTFHQNLENAHMPYTSKPETLAELSYHGYTLNAKPFSNGLLGFKVMAASSGDLSKR